jgi:arylsulfatase A-like enzyme
MTFTDFYTAGPVCSPTRASILTGKYTARTGITTYLLSPQRDAEYVTSQLNLDELTVAQALKDNGYATGYFEKWHPGYEMKHWASAQGFDTAKEGMDLDWAWKLCYPDRKPPILSRARGHTRFFSPHHLTHLENRPEGEYLTDRLTDETIHFIQQNSTVPL